MQLRHFYSQIDCKCCNPQKSCCLLPANLFDTLTMEWPHHLLVIAAPDTRSLSVWRDYLHRSTNQHHFTSCPDYCLQQLCCLQGCLSIFAPLSWEVTVGVGEKEMRKPGKKTEQIVKPPNNPSLRHDFLKKCPKWQSLFIVLPTKFCKYLHLFHFVMKGPLPCILILHFPGPETSKELYIYTTNSFGCGSTARWEIKAKLSVNMTK